MKIAKLAAATLMAATLILPTTAVAHAYETIDDSTPKNIAEVRAKHKEFVEKTNKITCDELKKDHGKFEVQKEDKEFQEVIGLPPAQFRKAFRELADTKLGLQLSPEGMRATHPELKSWSDKDLRESVELELDVFVTTYTKLYDCGLVEKKNAPAPQNPAPKPGTDTNNQGGTNNTKPPAGLGKSEGSGGSSFSS